MRSRIRLPVRRTEGLFLPELPLGLIEADLMLWYIHPLIEQTYQRLVDRRNVVRRSGDPFPRSVDRLSQCQSCSG